MAQPTETIRSFSDEEGYGFLGHDGGSDVFVHYAALRNGGYQGLKEGESVAFAIVQNEKHSETD